MRGLQQFPVCAFRAVINFVPLNIMRSANQSYLSIASVLEAIHKGETSAKAVVQSHLKAAQELNVDLNAYNAFNLDAVREAEQLDVRE